MWPKTDLIDILGIEHPVIQAPMAGSATPELAAAVSNAGGLGSLGCGAMSREEVSDNLRHLRTLTNRPVNLNFFAHPEPGISREANARARRLVQPHYRELGLGEAPREAAAPFGTFSADTAALLVALRPAVVSFHFGLPGAELLEQVRSAGCRVLCSATTVAEARALDASGVDAIIAQGWEAGGHRGSFETGYEDAGVGTMALVPQVVDAVGVPVIAAGGIADGRGIAAAFALGASGVQMGTAFLLCPEARISAAHRAALEHAGDDDTRLTRAFSGRPARARNNRYMESMARERGPLPGFPAMYAFSGPLEKRGAETGSRDYEFLLYGQAAALTRQLPAQELVRQVVDEARTALRAPGARPG